MELETVDNSTHDLHLNMEIDGLTLQPFAFKAIDYIQSLIELITNKAGSSDSKSIALIDYVWSHEAKDVAILLRDSSLKLLQIAQFQNDGLRSAQDVLDFQTTLQATLSEAGNHLDESLNKKLNQKGAIDPNWLHEISPSNLILEQLTLLIDQIKKIQRSGRKLYHTATALSDYRKAYIDHIALRKHRAQEWKTMLNNLLASFNKALEDIDANEVKKHATNIDQLIFKLENEAILPSYEHIVLEDINRLKLPVSSIEGQLMFKSIDVLSEISGWVSFHVDPPLRTIDQRMSVYKDRLIFVLFQISNRLKAKLESDDAEIHEYIPETKDSIKKLLKRYETEVEEGCLTSFDKLIKSIETLLVTSQFFSPVNNFLPSTKISQMAEETLKNSLLQRYQLPKIKQYFHQITGGIFEKYRSEEELSAAGYVSKFLNFDPGSDNNSLFLKKGFLGSSFTIVREELETKIKNHYDLWLRNYCGAILIEGGHSSGRSTLIEQIPIMFTDMKSHHIVKNQVIDIQGHKHVISNDLIKTIKFIIKHQGNERSIVTIDSFSSYANSPEKIFDLFSQLSELIMRNVRKIYFALVMHKELSSSLRQYFDFNNIFSEIIHTEDMPSSKIEEALLVRARAVYSLDQLQHLEAEHLAYANKIARQCQGKIGYGMTLWCNSDAMGDQFRFDQNFKHVVIRHRQLMHLLLKCGSLHIPSIINMLNEYDARAIRADFLSLVQLRLLIRPEEGVIAINPYLSPAVELILNK